MRYLDASVLVSAITNEPSSTEIRVWLGSQPPDELLISDWVSTEVAAAMSRKVRMGAIADARRRQAMRTFTALSTGTLTSSAVTRPDFRHAAELAERHETGLRAGDALHLAIAARLGATLHTLDVRQAEAGRALGIDTAIPIGQE
ncbi:hypothetical protein SAMN05661080_04009 [Modestobacter sp. DSM 44400]|uniref:type II toxin-antitoxin system VapC family toxin n=1 Tax=Modestobacter sp. DSM 44400 TaxID=1550230 RepID=UPI00089674AD|nr:type II toxin-antitoxin system VapC family toxin [Modestobacter sp. DSM 44400]SDY60403.1 hypothetical protein SAMN05661080_04009 [Modestobacter sp. DSM 44400]